jgi:hypothetical protein
MNNDIRYRVYNISKKESNKSYEEVDIEIHDLLNCDKLIEIFEYIISINEWDTDDLIIAFDNKEFRILRYKCSTVNDYNPTNDEEQSEKQIIQYYKVIDELN